MKRTKTRRRLVWLTSIRLALALTVGGGVLYVSDYYPADLDAIAAFSADASVTRTALDGYGFAYRADRDVNAGFLFYPGGKVEHTAYEPLMVALASQGIFCVLIEMPFRLAILLGTLRLLHKFRLLSYSRILFSQLHLLHFAHEMHLRLKISP